jgi:hypothetical protein
MQKMSFDPKPWAERECKFRGCTMFHAYPEAPCSKFCFTDVWQSLTEDPAYGLVTLTSERSQQIGEDRDKWDEKNRRLTAKKAEYVRRVNLILAEVNRPKQ